MDIKKYFKLALGKGASDLHLVSGNKPSVRIDGNLQTLTDEIINSDDLESAILVHYKVVLFDREIPSIVPQEIADLIKNSNENHQIGKSSAIMFFDPTVDVDENEKALFDSVTPNAINKQELETLIKQYI